jgi:hypothetical protein
MPMSFWCPQPPDESRVSSGEHPVVSESLSTAGLNGEVLDRGVRTGLMDPESR